MDRQSFYFFYRNLNSLTERALQEEAAKFLAQPNDTITHEQLSQEELDARVMAGFENLDFSALDGVDFSRTIALEPSSEEELQQRVDDHYQRVDLSTIDTALAQLPGNLPPLTSSLSPEDMDEWLRLYKQGHEVLTNLAMQVRQLT